MAAGFGRLFRFGADRIRRRFRGRLGQAGDAAGRIVGNAGRHCRDLHRDGFLLPYFRRPPGRLGAAGVDPDAIHRPGTYAGGHSGRFGRGRRRHRLGLGLGADGGHRVGGRRHAPHLFLGDMLDAAFSAQLVHYLPVIVPMGLFNLLGSLQNLESAEAAGDLYPVKSSLAVNGFGSMAAACFGSVFPTTIYIGHPGWKKMGAGAGYSVANGLMVTLLCLLGLVGFVSALVPVEAGAAILLWIGITISAQAFDATPREHAPAVVVGFFPALAAWGLLMLESALRAAGSNVEAVGIAALSQQLPVAGMLALERGFIFTSMILSAMTVCLIEKRYRLAAAWAATAAAISSTGLMHGYRIADGAILNAYGPEYTWPFVLGYSAMAAVFFGLAGLGKGKQGK